jgi:hypothetical protein
VRKDCDSVFFGSLSLRKAHDDLHYWLAKPRVPALVHFRTQQYLWKQQPNARGPIFIKTPLGRRTVTSLG